MAINDVASREIKFGPLTLSVTHKLKVQFDFHTFYKDANFKVIHAEKQLILYDVRSINTLIHYVQITIVYI